MALERGNGSAQPQPPLSRTEFVNNFMWNLTPEGKGKVEQGREQSSALLLLKNLVQVSETKRRRRIKSCSAGREAAGMRGEGMDQSKPSWITPTLQVPGALSSPSLGEGAWWCCEGFKRR